MAIAPCGGRLTRSLTTPAVTSKADTWSASRASVVLAAGLRVWSAAYLSPVHMYTTPEMTIPARRPSRNLGERAPWGISAECGRGVGSCGAWTADGDSSGAFGSMPLPGAGSWTGISPAGVPEPGGAAGSAVTPGRGLILG